ncbi:MAG: diguanylate cyclase, partial [Lachnospiraceae bacterium]|nr:diguanylate cyclase [Lachnospiraceae bacterium]
LVGYMLIRETLNISAYNKQLIELQDDHIVYVQAARLLRAGSDILTEHCRRFIITGDINDLKSYFREYNGDAHRDTALKLIEEMDQKAGNSSKLNKAKKESDELMITEYHAMALASLAWGLYDSGQLPDEILYYELTSYEKALSADDQLKTARELVFSNAYEKSKNKIHENSDSFLDEEIAAVDNRYNGIYQNLTLSIKYQRFLTYAFGVLLLITIFLLRRLNAINVERGRELQALNDKLTLKTDELTVKTREAENALSAKNQFLARMSNAVRNPINTIINVAERAKSTTFDEEKTRGYLEEVDSTAKILLELVNDVLDLDRTENKMVKIQKAQFNINNFIDSLMSIVSRLAGDAGLTLIKDIGIILHPNLIGDELHLRQAILNIADNAVKFTPAGGCVTFRIYEDIGAFDKDKGARYNLEIEDNGVGMSEKFLEHIFEDFTIEREGGTDNSGLGIGMSITKSYIELMGGTISVESELKHGTRFSISIPFEIYNSKWQESGDEKGSRLAGTNILVAEDNELNMEIARTMLINEGAVVTPAENGLVALSLFDASKENTFDAILMDVAMPVLDGITVTKEIRSRTRNDARTVPIIAMVAGTDQKDIGILTESGMNDYISKPVDVNQLVKTLINVIKKQTTELAQQLDKALKDANTDALTGVKNRNAFELAKNRINVEIGAGEEPEFAIVVCDVNGLKYINDNVGHDAGNKLLINACRLICTTFKRSPVFRIGGDEFVAILRNDDYASREEYMKGIMEKMTAERYNPSDINKVSFATGMSEFIPGADKDCDDVFKRADALMYEHKKQIKGESNVR